MLEKQERLLEEKERLGREILQKRIQVEMCEWVTIGRENIKQIMLVQQSVDKAKDYLVALRSEYDVCSDRRKKLIDEHTRLTQLLELRKAFEMANLKISKLRHEEQILSLRIIDIEKSVEKYAKNMITAERIAPLRSELSSYPSSLEQREIISYLNTVLVSKEVELSDINKKLIGQISILDKSKNSNALIRKFKGLPNPANQQVEVSNLQSQFISLQSEINARQIAKVTHERKLVRIIELDSELSRYEQVGTLGDESDKKKKAGHALIAAKNQFDIIQEHLHRAENAISSILESEATNFSRFPSSLDDDYRSICEELLAIDELPTLIEKAHQVYRDAINKFDRLFSDFIFSMNAFDRGNQSFNLQSNDLNGYLAEFSKIELITREANISTLQVDIDQFEDRLDEIEKIILHISRQLTELEKEVIHDAKILGATLTKAYLSDAIQERTFDTVILDEASMAPIPALWMAASLADSNLILVGDFKQLSPICISSHPIAKKWLGRDIFEVSELQDAYEQGKPPAHFISLNKQFRMRPEIAAIANLFYDGLLNSDDAPKVDSEQFLQWFNSEWKFDQSPVCFVDTSELNAWVTSVPNGDRASRLNFLSAALCVDMAEQLLAEKRKKHEGGERRVLIVSPYKAHSKLIRLMIGQNKAICEEVESGTVHSFQGSEADVVIFDLVLDEPHWSANLFTPLADESNKRIYNVAMTRARQRLIIVGDFQWCSKGGKKVFLGKDLLPFIKNNYPVFLAKEVIPNGLAARAARAQWSMLGGVVEASSDRLVLSQSEFFPVLANDIEQAKSRVVIFSPFMTKKRVSFLLPQLQAAIERGVAIFVVTKSHAERNKTELQVVYEVEEQLKRIGIFVMYKMHMHEKIVLIDDKITWSGSLNPLSFSDTQEIMERRLSSVIQQDYREVLQVDALIGVCGKPEAVCPICNCSMIAREGDKGSFFWRCESNDCKYSRNIGSPYPVDGVIRCKACGGDVELGEWGGKPHWRCKENRKHHMMIFKSHLRLKKMVDLIPEKQRKIFLESFGLAYEVRLDTLKPSNQMTLW